MSQSDEPHEKRLARHNLNFQFKNSKLRFVLFAVGQRQFEKANIVWIEVAVVVWLFYLDIPTQAIHVLTLEEDLFISLLEVLVDILQLGLIELLDFGVGDVRF